jgi:rRNA processing protein Krr1/Pno1
MNQEPRTYTQEKTGDLYYTSIHASIIKLFNLIIHFVGATEVLQLGVVCKIIQTPTCTRLQQTSQVIWWEIQTPTYLYLTRFSKS